MEDEFYITLLSDSSTVLHPDNSTSCFTNKLQKRLVFYDSWEVALHEIHFPMTLCNFYGQNSRAWTKHGGMTRKRCIIENTYTLNVENILERIQKDLENEYTFKLFKNKVTCNSDIVDDVRLRFTKTLAMQLGFPNNTDLRGQYIQAPHPPDFNVGIPSQAYIYCNIVKPQLFGDRVSQILKCITIDIKSYVHGGSGCIAYKVPQYAPVALKEVDEISIDIKDREEEYLPFISGTCSVLLHFRRCSSST